MAHKVIDSIGFADFADTGLPDQFCKIISCVYVCQHGQSALHVADKLTRDVVRVVARVQRDDPGVALGVEVGDLVRVDFVMEDHIVEG